MILLIALFVLGGYVINDKIVRPYNQTQGAITMRDQIAISQAQTGDILIVNGNNLTTMNIQEICGGGE